MKRLKKKRLGEVALVVSVVVILVLIYTFLLRK